MSVTTTARTFPEIVSSMLTYAASQGIDVTDFRAGSVFRTMLEAVALIAQEGDEDRDSRLDADIATSAYRSFGFGLAPAQSASGTVRITPSTSPHGDIAIPSGRAFGVPGTNLQYVSIQPATLVASASYIDLLVQCTQPGSIGNVPANAITRFISPISGLSSAVTNTGAFITGKDPEGELDRRRRFADYMTAMHRGTAQSIAVGVGTAVVLDAYGAIQSRVGRVSVVESPGIVTVYITDATIQTGTTPAAAAPDSLVASAQLLLDGGVYNGVVTPGYRAAGVKATAVAAQTHPLSVNLALHVAAGFNPAGVQASVQTAVERVFSGQDIGSPLPFRASQIRKAVLSVRGVGDCNLILPSIDRVGIPGVVYTLIPFSSVANNPPLGPSDTTSWIQLY